MKPNQAFSFSISDTPAIEHYQRAYNHMKELFKDFGQKGKLVRKLSLLFSKREENTLLDDITKQIQEYRDRRNIFKAPKIQNGNEIINDTIKNYLFQTIECYFLQVEILEFYRGCIEQWYATTHNICIVGKTNQANFRRMSKKCKKEFIRPSSKNTKQSLKIIQQIENLTSEMDIFPPSKRNLQRLQLIQLIEELNNLRKEKKVLCEKGSNICIQMNTLTTFRERTESQQVPSSWDEVKKNLWSAFWKKISSHPILFAIIVATVLLVSLFQWLITGGGMSLWNSIYQIYRSYISSDILQKRIVDEGNLGQTLFNKNTIFNLPSTSPN